MALLRLSNFKTVPVHVFRDKPFHARANSTDIVKHNRIEAY